MKIHSLSSHHYADRGMGEVFESTKQNVHVHYMDIYTMFLA